MRLWLAFGLMTALWACQRMSPESHRSDASHGLGVVDFAVSCTSPAQAEFARALALLHHMTYPEAREAFQAVARADSNCAMAHWGVAMTLFQPLWPTRPSLADRQLGWAAIERARSLTPATEREKAFVEVAAAFFADPASDDYWPRIHRWEVATSAALSRFPTDHDMLAFHALAYLAITPAAVIDRSNADSAAGLLLRVFRQNPMHPGAMHYLVHANDVPGREMELLDITRAYDSLAPRNPHALHMPTHIYTRLGDWPAVIAGNRRAAEAALEHRAGDAGQYVWDEFPHAIEYLVYAHLQAGDDAASSAQVARMHSMTSLEPSFKTAFHLSSIPARHVLERHAWSEALALVPRQPATLEWDRFAWPEAIVHFARGVGAARTAQLTEARRSLLRLEQLVARMDSAGENLFERNIRVLALGLRGWLSHADGQHDSGVRFLREAAELEASTPKHAVTPAPTIPASEMLGDMLLEQRRYAEALAAYQTSLRSYPNRFNSVFGSAQASLALGDSAGARTSLMLLRAIASPASNRPALRTADEVLMRPGSPPASVE